MMETSLNKRVAAFFVLLFVSLTLSYANTLSSPFNFDDEVVIKTEIATTEVSEDLFFKFYPPRYRHLFYLSLLFNYSWGELDPFGYHLFNISLHLLTCIAVFFIAFVTIERGTSWGRSAAGAIATITALAFALNPVHSETVNYISARAVGLGGLFYLSALLLFILGSFRERGGVSRILFYAGSLICFIASVLSKETGLTFPAAVLLYDFCFMRRDGWTSFKNRFLLFYLPFLACGAFAVLTILSMKTMILDWWGKIDFSYALKQARIVGHGIHLLLFPVGLTFDYDFPDGFFPHPARRAWPILLLAGLVIFAARYFRRAAAMISFGVLWFLLTIAPTNSILPRTDLLNERNLYLPSFGVFLLLATTVYYFILAEHRRPVIRKVGASCLAVFFIFQAALLLDRNTLYRSNTLLWEDTVKKAPGNFQALHNLSHFYL
ncbi:MAG: hypothetical protein IID18_10140, partial [Nitrospinae bacterium]|nr:hypothetical protein [Nitrospinota bacterium]